MEKLRKPTKTTTITESLRKDILSGVFASDERLTLASLKQRYGVGYSPLREALSRLASYGLVYTEEQCGFRIAQLSLAEFYDLYRVRCFIEAEALSLSMEHGDAHWEADVKTCWQAYRAFLQPKPKQAIQPAEWDIKQKEFLHTLVKACQSPWLLKLHEMLCEHAERYRNICFNNQYKKQQFLIEYIKSTERLVKAVLARNTKLALKLNFESWEETIQIIASHLQISK